VTGRVSMLLRGLGLAAAMIAYSIIAHETNVSPGEHPLGVILALAPLLGLAVALTWRTAYRFPCLCLCLLIFGGVIQYWSLLTAHSTWLYLLQQCATYVFLGGMFGASLLRGRMPLCTRFATMVHGPLAPAVAGYTRSVTLAWALFFAVLTLVLVALFILAPLSVWSLFANFFTFPLIVSVFVVEYAVRKRVLPEMRHEGILRGVRAFFNSPSDAAIARRR